MGLLSDFFAATPDELASFAIRWGPGGAPPAAPSKPKRGLFGFGRPAEPEPAPIVRQPSLPAVQLKGLTNVELGTLDELVTGTPYQEVMEGGLFQPIRDGGAEGPWVFGVRRELRDRLAVLTQARRREVATGWAATEEMRLSRADDIAQLEAAIRDLQDLARAAAEGSRDLYLWVSL